MDSQDKQEEATELLQQLGLQEYEAKCFVGLTRTASATAKELNEITDVPRTRVYDAIRVLEAQGLVEIQHSSPQEFRAVPLDEAIGTLEDQFESRLDRLRDSLRGIEAIEMDEEAATQEVWALSGSTAIANRTQQLIQEATDEVVLILGEQALLTEELFDTLNGLSGTATLIIGAVGEDTRDEIQEAVPDAEVFVSGLEWLSDEGGASNGTAIGRLLLVDRGTLLVSSYEVDTGVERAVFGTGFGNGLIVITRRLMETGLLPIADPRPE